ncbi:MAG: DUF202 domain-containing protein [Bacteroidota bacterium]
MILRDYLALDRTKLANQRTLLSFVRTSLYLVVSGVALLNVKILQDIRFMGFFLLGISVLTFIAGVVNFFYFRRKMHSYYQDPPEES